MIWRRSVNGVSIRAVSLHPRQLLKASGARHALVLGELQRGPRRLYEDHLGMRSRRLTAVSSFASVGATDGDADRIAAAERAARSQGAKRSDNALVTGVCLMAPLLAFLTLVYAAPFLGVAAERHAAEARARAIRAACRRSARFLCVRAHLSHLRDRDGPLGGRGLHHPPMSGCEGRGLSDAWSSSAF